MKLTPRVPSIRRLLGPAFLTLGILAFTRVCFVLIQSRYVSGKPTRLIQDLASINQAIWNTANGNVLKATILYDGVRDHLELILFPYALIYRLGGDLQHILQLHVLLVGLGAIPVYLIGRARGLVVTESLVLASLYLLQPLMHEMFLKEYLRSDLLFFPVMATMAYALVCEKRGALIAAIVMSLFCKESASFTLIGLGAYLCWIRWERTVGIVCLVLGTLWLPLFHLLLVQVNGHASKTANLGRLIGFDRLERQIDLVWPIVLWAVVLLLLLLRRGRGPVLAILPHTLALVLYRVNLRHLAAPFAFTAVLLLDTIAQWQTPWTRRAVLAALATGLIAINHSHRVWRFETPSEAILQAQPLIELIPDRASLCTERPLLLQLSKRRKLYQFNRSHYFPREGKDYTEAEYFLIRRAETRQKKKRKRRFETQELAIAELDSWNMEKVATSGPWVLYRKPSPP